VPKECGQLTLGIGSGKDAEALFPLFRWQDPDGCLDPGSSLEVITPAAGDPHHPGIVPDGLPHHLAGVGDTPPGLAD
jgi:hypothetical protein